MAGDTSSFKGVLADFPTPILTKIDGEPTRKGLINLHQLISGNAASVSSNPREGRHGHFALVMTDEEYSSNAGFALVPTHSPGNYPQSMRSPKNKHS